MAGLEDGKSQDSCGLVDEIGLSKNQCKEIRYYI